jgi:hypothetical protein
MSKSIVAWPGSIIPNRLDSVPQGGPFPEAALPWISSPLKSCDHLALLAVVDMTYRSVQFNDFDNQSQSLRASSTHSSHINCTSNSPFI